MKLNQWHKNCSMSGMDFSVFPWENAYNTVNHTTGCGMMVQPFPLLHYYFQLHSQKLQSAFSTKTAHT
jgi:hypothetical protein